MLRTIRSNFNTPDGSPPWSVECGLCNVIAGPTASGKTTIVHAIEYGTTGLVNDVHGRNALKQVGRVGMLTGNKKLVNELLDERGQPYKGVCLSDAVREALTSESKGATEFFASYLPDPYKGWFEGLAEQQQAFLQKRGLEKSSLEGVLKALDQIDDNAVQIEQRLLRLSVDRANAADALHEAEQRRADAQTRLEQARLSVQARLRSLLRLQAQPTLAYAWTAEDFQHAVDKERLLRKLAEADLRRLTHYREQLAELQKLTDERDAALRKLDALHLELHEQRARGEQERKDKQALLRALDDDRKFAERLVKNVDEAHRALTGQILALKEWQERKYTFAMTQGHLLPPVTGRVEVGYGDVRHPRFGTVTMHRGIDYRAGVGASVRAVFWGRVAFVGWLTGYGTTVIVDHGRGWHTVYAHLEDVTVVVGELLPARSRVGLIGQSGSIKGRFLYFEIRHNGQPVNPTEWFYGG